MSEFVVVLEERVIEAENISEAREKAEKEYDSFEEVLRP